MTISSPVQLPPVHPFTGMDVASALADRASRFADREFLAWEPGSDGVAASWTYASFAASVERVAAGLVERGVGRGDALMLLIDNSPAFLLCWFACARIGAVAIDTNTRYAADELAYALERTDAVGIVTHERLASTVGSVAGERWIVCVDEASGTCPALVAADEAAGAAALPPIAGDPGAALCVQFTSGTTSWPKAVLYTHANALWGASVGASHARLSGDDVTLVYAPLFHTMALSWQMLATFWVGGKVVLQPRFSASRFWEVSNGHGCTYTSVLGIVLATVGRQPCPPHSYRILQFGLEVPEVEEHFGVRLFNCWGMTEVVTNVIVGNLDVPAEPRAIGRVSAEYQIRIVGDDGADAAIGERGELRVGGIRGLSLFAGYHGDSQATEAVFDERGYFRTGDGVRLLRGGAVQFVARLKDMLKVGGENVAAAEIERVVAMYPGVAAVAAVGRPDPMLDEVAVAFVVASGPVDDVDGFAAAVIAHCREHLADFKVPRAVHLLPALPEATLGKIATGTLRAMAIDLAG